MPSSRRDVEDPSPGPDRDLLQGLGNVFDVLQDVPASILLALSRKLLLSSSLDGIKFHSSSVSGKCCQKKAIVQTSKGLTWFEPCFQFSRDEATRLDCGR